MAAWSAEQAGGSDWDTHSVGGEWDSAKGDENVKSNVKAAETGWIGHGVSASSHKPIGGDNNCRNCGSDDHFARNCPEAAKERGCFNCGQEGHYKSECPVPPKGRACFNCGEEGHTKVECTKPRVFRGTCRLCQQEGHPISECPEKGPEVCRNCDMEGHSTIDCKSRRRFHYNHLPDLMPEVAWPILKKASDERDLEDFRSGLINYSKSAPAATFADIEVKMRKENFNVYLIAMEKEIGDTIVSIDLQGQLDRKYVVGFYYSPMPHREHLRARWPSSPEENLERLAEAGLPYDRLVPKCSNCGQLGHSARACKEERISTYERVEVKCFNCGGAGHRARDCTEPRRDKFACRNCGQPGHKASDCTEPRSAAGVECRNCGKVGHFAKDCPDAEPRTCRNCGEEGHMARDCDKPRAARTCRNCGSEDHVARDCDQPRNPATVTCRNCDEVGHFSRDCTKKKDWSRVECRECGEMGHTARRCPLASAAGNNGQGASAGQSNWDAEKTTSKGGEWGTDPKSPNDGEWASGNQGFKGEDAASDAGNGEEPSAGW